MEEYYPNSDVICHWWDRCEFSEQRGDWQTDASLDVLGADLQGDDTAVSDMLEAPLTEPPSDFNVTCVYDSRPVNGYDFNYSAFVTEVESEIWAVEFNVPTGYRAVPRDWTVFFDVPPPGPAKTVTVSITQNGAAVPNNQNIVVGMGTGDSPIETFFVCEENTKFGMLGLVDTANTGQTTTVYVNCHGNLIPVSDEALPYAVANHLSGALAAQLLED